MQNFFGINMTAGGGFACSGFAIRHSNPETAAALTQALCTEGLAVKGGLLGRGSARRLAGTPEMDERVQQLMALVRQACTELHIPPQAPCIDVIAAKYEVVNGVERPVDFSPLARHWNLEMSVFTEENMLCLADLSTVYAVPLAGVGAIWPEKQRAHFPNWHKAQPPEDPVWRPYQITADRQGSFFAFYCTVPLQTPQGEMALLIPEYDRRSFAGIVGRTIDIRGGI